MDVKYNMKSTQLSPLHTLLMKPYLPGSCAINAVASCSVRGQKKKKNKEKSRKKRIGGGLTFCGRVILLVGSKSSNAASLCQYPKSVLSASANL